MAGVIELKENFKKLALQALMDNEPDNPIYRVLESKSILKDVGEHDPQRYILERFNLLEEKLLSEINKINQQSNIYDVRRFLRNVESVTSNDHRLNSRYVEYEYIRIYVKLLDSDIKLIDKVMYKMSEEVFPEFDI
jgi:hypothetical protein